MKIGLLGLVASDWKDVDYNRIRFAAELGFHGVGAHLSVPASTITDELAAHVKSVYDDQKMPFLQIWGPYPCIISPDETIRKSGVEGARDAHAAGAIYFVVGAVFQRLRGQFCADEFDVEI